MIRLEPTEGHPVPYDTAPDEVKTFQDEVVVAANTAEVLNNLGADIAVETEDIDKIVELFKHRKKAEKSLQQPNTASAAAMFLKSYANRVAIDAAEIRSAVTAKLMELANCGDPRYELKALELLGKHSDIGLFTERSEITINHKTSADLEDAIKERIKRLLNANVIDVTPIAESLDVELGTADPDPEETQLAPNPSDNDDSASDTE